MSVKVTTDGLLGCQKMSQTFVSRDEALHFLENAFLMSHNSPVMYKLNRKHNCPLYPKPEWQAQLLLFVS